MSFPRSIFVVVILASAVAIAFAADKPGSPGASAPPILPQQFGGWQIKLQPQATRDAFAADPANAPVLKEYGFTDFESGTYTRDDGRTLKIRAARFDDASGAFGAYTFYLQPEMAREQIGDQGASTSQRVLFYRGHVLVDALFSQVSAMSAAELRELAGVLPRPAGNAGTLPPVLTFMPHHGYVANTQRYAEGPKALSTMDSPLPADLIDFSASPEVTLGQYTTPSGPATLMLIYYPTPQIAIEHLRRIDAAHQVAEPKSGESSVEKVGPFFDRRSGPIVAIAAGPISERDAQTLLGAVNYEASVTWNENTYFDKRNNLANFLVNLIILCMILGVLAVATGVAFGGVRVLVKRFFPGRIFDRPEQVEFISLHLAETMAQGSPSTHSGNAKSPNTP